MAPSLRSPSDSALRSIPAHHHRPRFPSLTEFPDSPSVYSHAYQSPDTTSFSRLSDSPGRPELDDETASTIRSLSPEQVPDDCDDMGDFTDDASHRISLQGPRIRFHSRAPWETDDDASHIEGLGNHSRSGTFGNKFKGKVSRTDSLIRTFTRGSSIGSRPSVESARSKVSVASSFEAMTGNSSSSRGALYDLARQSISTSSLASSSTSVRSRKLTRPTNYAQSSRRTHDSLSGAAVSLDGLVPSATTLEDAAMLSSSCHTSPVGRECNTKPPLASAPSSQVQYSHDQFIHPYANPDLVPYTPSPETKPSHHSDLEDMVGSDSHSTVTDTVSTRSAAFPVISTQMSTTSLTSRDTPYGNLRVNGKEISSPISVVHQNDNGYVDRSTRFLSLHPPPAGFEGPRQSNLNPRQPAVTLITLQEAQARERFRSSTVQGAVSRSKLLSPSSNDITKTTGDEIAGIDSGKQMVHTRARSTSAGSRHKTAPLLPAQLRNVETKDESPVSTPVGATPGRALKHKKSGFMRLFSGRNSEGDKERGPPPPVPLHADTYVEDAPQACGTGKTPKPVLSKIPKSSFSPPLRPGSSNTTLASTYSASSGCEGSDGKDLPLRRRQPPSLSIVTKVSDQSITTSVLGISSPMGLNSTPAPRSLIVPQSAPPGNGDFSGLKLRPVSSSFSSHFADMVSTATEGPQYDVHTPSSAASSNTALSPFTPVSTRRSDDASATAVEGPGDEYLTVKGLQDQFVSAERTWQQQVWELRGQIRDLTSELDDLRAADNRDYCEACGRGDSRKRHVLPLDEQLPKKTGVVNRPRARTGGDTARFASGN